MSLRCFTEFSMSCKFSLYFAFRSLSSFVPSISNTEILDSSYTSIIILEQEYVMRGVVPVG